MVVVYDVQFIDLEDRIFTENFKTLKQAERYAELNEYDILGYYEFYVGK